MKEMMGMGNSQLKEGYRKTRLGWIPEDWEVKRLEEFIISSSYGPRFSAELYDEKGNCRVIRGTDVITNGKVNYSEIPYARIADEVLEKHRLIEKDLVVITTADCGMSFVFDEVGVFMPSAYMVRLRFNDKIDPYFINRFFDTEIIKKQVKGCIRKGTVANLPGSDLLKFKVYVPSLPEQKKIASILSLVDGHIEEVDNMIEDLKELKKGLMQKLLTGQYSIDNGKLVKTKEFKKTRLGMIPKGWEVKKLETLIKIIKGKKPKEVFEYKQEGHLPYILIDTCITKEFELYTNDKTCRKCDKDDVLILWDGSRAGLVFTNMIGYIGSTIAALKIENVLKLDYKFLYYYLDVKVDFIQANRIGSGIPHVDRSFLNQLSIPVPSIPEQQKIASILSSVDERIEVYQIKKEDLQKLKKGLMQQLLTGKTRVKIN